jgi:hypothetical protein
MVHELVAVRFVNEGKEILVSSPATNELWVLRIAAFRI